MVLFWMVVVGLCMGEGDVVCMPDGTGGAWSFLEPFLVGLSEVCTWVTKIGDEVFGIAFIVGVVGGVAVGGRADGRGLFGR